MKGTLCLNSRAVTLQGLHYEICFEKELKIEVAVKFHIFLDCSGFQFYSQLC